LATVIPAMEDMIGNTIERLFADAGYRGHNAPTDYKFRIYTSGQKRNRGLRLHPCDIKKHEKFLKDQGIKASQIEVINARRQKSASKS